MSNEERILAILETMQADIATIKREQAEMKREQAEIKSTLNAVFDHTVQLTERHTITDQAIKDLTAVTKANAMDILKLRAAQ